MGFPPLPSREPLMELGSREPIGWLTDIGEVLPNPAYAEEQLDKRARDLERIEVAWINDPRPWTFTEYRFPETREAPVKTVFPPNVAITEGRQMALIDGQLVPKRGWWRWLVWSGGAPNPPRTVTGPGSCRGIGPR